MAGRAAAVVERVEATLRDGRTRGGHLLEAHVRPTLEVVVAETGSPIQRAEDAATGLPMIDAGG